MKQNLFSDIEEITGVKRSGNTSLSVAQSYGDHTGKIAGLTQEVVSAIPTPLIFLLPNFHIITANKAFYETFKITPGETEGKIIYELENGRWDTPQLRKILEELLLKKSNIAGYEMSQFFPDGALQKMRVNACRLTTTAKDEPVTMLAFEDVTDKLPTETTIHKERDMILENIPGGLIVLNNKWQFSYCTKNAEWITGKKFAAIEGKSIWKVLPQLVETSFPSFCRKVKQSGKPAAFEQFMAHTGAWYNITVVSSASGLSLYFEDITKHKKSEETIESERQKMFSLFMNAPASICVFRGPEHIYELANKPYTEMVGVKRNLIGIPVRKAIPELKKQGIFEILDEVYRTGNPFTGREVSLKLHAAGSTKAKDIVLDLIFQPYNDTHGRVEGIISYAVDITALVNKRKRIEELLKQKDDFLGVASHELKTPVTSIKGYTQILQMRFSQEGNAKAFDLLSRMDGQINKLTKLISDLLDVTKIEGGKLPYHETDFDFNDLVKEVVEEMEQIPERGNIITNLASTAVISGDRDRIGQVITNFISNAIKYSHYNGDVILTTSVGKNTVKLCVQDFGIGINKQNQKRVFDRFYRVSDNKEHTFPGMGLGLFISSEIIKKHRGRISVKSAKGKGSTFCFVLPVK